MQEGYNASAKRTSGNVNLNYQGSKGEVTAGYGYDSYSAHYNYSLRGGMLAHSSGITLSRYLGESVRWLKRLASAILRCAGRLT